MKKRMRALCFSVAFMVLCSSILKAAPAYAAETVQSTQTELEGLEITDLAEPVAGQPLDNRATVKPAEGASWEISVVWMDDNGKAASVAEAGHKYLPTFVFYVPSGCKVKDSGDASGSGSSSSGSRKDDTKDSTEDAPEEDTASDAASDSEGDNETEDKEEHDTVTPVF